MQKPLTLFTLHHRIGPFDPKGYSSHYGCGCEPHRAARERQRLDYCGALASLAGPRLKERAQKATEGSPRGESKETGVPLNARLLTTHLSRCRVSSRSNLEVRYGVAASACRGQCRYLLKLGRCSKETTSMLLLGRRAHCYRGLRCSHPLRNFLQGGLLQSFRLSSHVCV